MLETSTLRSASVSVLSEQGVGRRYKSYVSPQSRLGCYDGSQLIG